MLLEGVNTMLAIAAKLLAKKSEKLKHVAAEDKQDGDCVWGSFYAQPMTFVQGLYSLSFVL